MLRVDIGEGTPRRRAVPPASGDVDLRRRPCPASCSPYAAAARPPDPHRPTAVAGAQRRLAGAVDRVARPAGRRSTRGLVVCGGPSTAAPGRTRQCPRWRKVKTGPLRNEELDAVVPGGDVEDDPVLAVCREYAWFVTSNRGFPGLRAGRGVPRNRRVACAVRCLGHGPRRLPAFRRARPAQRARASSCRSSSACC